MFSEQQNERQAFGLDLSSCPCLPKELAVLAFTTHTLRAKVTDHSACLLQGGLGALGCSAPGLAHGGAPGVPTAPLWGTPNTGNMLGSQQMGIGLHRKIEVGGEGFFCREGTHCQSCETLPSCLSSSALVWKRHYCFDGSLMDVLGWQKKSV